ISFLALVFVYFLCRFNHLSLKLEKGKDTYTVLWCGLCFGIHWVSYFYALSLSSVAIGMLAIYTYPVITSFLEPVLLKTSFVKAQIVLGRSEEHTSELQSRENLVCRLLLEKK